MDGRKPPNSGWVRGVRGSLHLLTPTLPSTPPHIWVGVSLVQVWPATPRGEARGKTIELSQAGAGREGDYAEAGATNADDDGSTSEG